MLLFHEIKKNGANDLLEYSRSPWENTAHLDKHKWGRVTIKTQRKFVKLAHNSCSPSLALHGKTVKKLLPPLRRETNKWPICSMIWLVCHCVKDLFLSCRTCKVKGMTAPCGHTVLATQTKSKHLFKQRKLQSWRQRDEGITHFHVTIVF